MNVKTKRRMLIETAAQFIGVTESGVNKGPLIEMFQKEVDGKAAGEPWCVSFVQYCVREVDRRWLKEQFGKTLAQTLLFKTESSRVLWERTPHVARSDYGEVGDIQVWAKYDASGNITPFGHVGIVTDVLPNGYVLTIEGNTGAGGSGVEREGDGVFVKRRPAMQNAGSMRTLGFLSPWAY